MEDKSRLTVDMPSSQHALLKMACAKLGISMKAFLIRCAFEKIEEFEDELLAKQAAVILEEIEAGNQKVISWKEMKQRIL